MTLYGFTRSNATPSLQHHLIFDTTSRNMPLFKIYLKIFTLKQIVLTINMLIGIFDREFWNFKKIIDYLSVISTLSAIYWYSIGS